jgi:hypothetical protein
VDFEKAYQLWIESHLNRREGERKRRLLDGHRHAEKLFLQNVWWPAVGRLDHLHPEYQVYDLSNHFRFIDFAYIQSFFKIAFEVDGYGPHMKQISRRQFSDELLRQSFMAATGWIVLRFSYDDVADNPMACIHLIRLMMGRFYGTPESQNLLPIEKEVIRTMIRQARPITPKEVSDEFKMDPRTTYKILKQLLDKQWIRPAKGTKRIRSYHLDLTGKEFYI